MARVDFYILGKAGDLPRNTFACRLAEKVYRLDRSVHIQAEDQQQARLLDDLLWTFRDGSFVPHEMIAANDTHVEAPVTIAFTADAIRPADLLINLANRLPPDLKAFPRVAEIVTSDEDRKDRSRKLFADYRSKGHSLETHDL